MNKEAIRKKANLAYDGVMEIITPLSAENQYFALRLLTNWLESKEAEIYKTLDHESNKR